MFYPSFNNAIIDLLFLFSEFRAGKFMHTSKLNCTGARSLHAML